MKKDMEVWTQRGKKGIEPGNGGDAKEKLYLRLALVSAMSSLTLVVWQYYET